MGNRALSALLAVFAVLGLAACGGEQGEGEGSQGSSAGEGEDRGALVVSAASSLTDAFEAYADEVVYPERVRFSFAGSDGLAAQIRQGVKPDLLASSDTALPNQLHEERLVRRPVVFAANQLVVAVPAEGGRVHTLAQLARPGTTIAIGAEGVPVGDYARELLRRLGRAQERAILANVRSEEPDVKGIVGKLEQGAVDAGFVYLTDVRATDKRLGAVLLPPRLRPAVAYAIALVEGAERPAQARRFVAGLLRGRGLQIMRAAGFEAAVRR